MIIDLINSYLIYFLLIIIYYSPYFLQTLLIKLLVKIGGPVFIKLAQNILVPEYGFKQGMNILLKNKNEGSISTIIRQDNYIIKHLHLGIDRSLQTSLVYLKNLIIISQFCFIFDFDQFSEIMKRQTNFRLEMVNNCKIYFIFENIKLIKIPRIVSYSKYKLVMEYSHGINIRQYLENNNNENIIDLLQLSLYLMIVNNYVHADWHESNFLVENDSLVILDYGLVVRLNQKNFKLVLDLFLDNFFFPDPDKLIQFIIEVNLNQSADLFLFSKSSKNYLRKIKWVNVNEFINNPNLPYYQILYNFLTMGRKSGIVLPIGILFFIKHLFLLMIRSSFSVTYGNRQLWRNRLKFAKKLDFIKELKTQLIVLKIVNLIILMTSLQMTFIGLGINFQMNQKITLSVGISKTKI